MVITARRLRGYRAEQLAKRYLKLQGLKHLCSNYHCRFGEIDIIMRDKQVMVFIEVRSRHDSELSEIVNSITPSKQRRIIRSATHYLLHHDLLDQVNCRFDVVAVNDSQQQLQWLKHAFTTDF